MESLGPIIAGAILGGVPGAAVGAAVAAAGALYIYIQHSIENSVTSATALKAEALKIAGTIPLPKSTTPSVTGATELDALVAKIVSMSTALQDAGQTGVNAARAVIDSLYEVEQTGFGEFRRVLIEEFSRINDASQALGITLSSSDLEALIAKWSATLEEGIPGGLSGISDYIKGQLPKDIQDAIGAMGASVKGELDAEGFAAFMSSLSEKVSEFLSTITRSVDEDDIATSIDLWNNFFSSLSGMQSEAELSKARSRIQQWFALITKGFSEKEMAAFAMQLSQAGMSFESVSEIMDMLGISSANLKAELLKLWDAAQKTSETIPTTYGEMASARKEFSDLFYSLSAEDVSITTASKSFEELTKMADDWARYAKVAKDLGWESADAIQGLADYMDDLVGEAEDAASAVERFTKALESVALAAGASQQIQGIFSDFQKLLQGASTLGEAADIMGALQSGEKGSRSFLDSLEMIFAPDSTYAEESKAWARKTWQEIGDQFPKLGSTIEDLTAQAKDLASEQKKQATEAARAAQEAAEKAYEADQAAFKNQFIRPVLDAVATGDFAAAANQIDALTGNFAGLVNQGAKLGMSATEVIGMVTSARSELLSAIDGLIQINGKYPDIVAALQSARDQIEKMWAEPKTALEKALDELNLKGLIENPAGVASRLRALAEQDAKAVSEYVSQLVSELQKEIDARKALGYDTTSLESILYEFQSAITGTLSPLGRFMNALDEYASGIAELADAILPGLGNVFTSAMDLGKAISSTGGLAWSKGKPVALAEGGIATSPTYALIGEAGPEAIIPLSDLTNLSGGSISGDAIGSSMISPYTDVAPLSNQAPFTLDTSALGEGVSAFTTQIGDLGAQILQAAAGLVSAIRESTIAITGSLLQTAEKPLGLDLPNTGAATITAENITIPEEKPLGLDLPGLESSIEYIPESVNTFSEMVTQAVNNLSEIAASLRAPITSVAESASAMAQIPEIPTFDSGADAVDQFTPDTVAQALAKALTASSITPGATAASSGLPGLIDSVVKLGPVFNSAISFIVSAGKMIYNFIKDFLEKRLAKLQEMLQIYTEKLGGILDKLAGSFSGLLGTLGSVLSQAIAMTYLEGNDLIKAGIDLVTTALFGFADAVTGTIQQMTSYQQAQSAWGELMQSVRDIFGQFLWPIVAAAKWLKKFLGVVEETTNTMNSLNIPEGYKVALAEWKAATPGVPGALKDEGSQIPEWAEPFGASLAASIMAILENLGIAEWGNNIAGIASWGDLVTAIADGSVTVPMLQEIIQGGTWGGWLDSIKNSAIDLWNWITGQLPAIIESVTASLRIVQKFLSDNGITLEGIIGWIKNGITWLIANLPSIVQNVVTFVGNVWNALVAVYNWAVANLPTWNDINGAINSFITALGDIPTANELSTEIGRITNALSSLAKILTYAMIGVGATLVGAIIGGAGLFSPAALFGALAGAELGLLTGRILDLVGAFDSGGFTTSEGLAYVHKNEYIIPVAKANSLAMAGVGGNGNMTFRLEVDRKVLGQVIIQNGRDGLTRSTGSSMGRAWK
jgi:hypothetical protein